MNIPAVLRARLEADFGPIRAVRPVGGGCISPASRITFADRDAFLKYGLSSPAGFFASEANGLACLRSAAPELCVPGVYGAMDREDLPADEPGWILMEWLEPAPRANGWAERLGRGLAALHRVRHAEWGWSRDGYIGSLPQDNRVTGRWSDFWRDRRLEPQLRLARQQGRLPGHTSDWDRLFARLDDLLAPAERDGASLLHGDLWGGNVLAVRPVDAGDAQPALIDPSAYHGHREVDLAMADLFGGFDTGFHTAYQEAWPLEPGYGEGRRPVYQLYYLLVHVNLFGGDYRTQTEPVLRAALSA